MQSNSSKRGFTLIELLVVITIIVIASSIIFVAGGGGDGAALSSSQRIISGIAQGARGQAILKNARTRLIIYSDVSSNQDDDKRLRFFGIVYESEPGSDRWIAATQGTYLPEGIYFDPEASDAAVGFNIPYPRAVELPQGGGEQYFYYEFNSNGTVSTKPINFANKKLVFRAGTLKPGDSGTLEPDFTEEGKEFIASGFILRRVGTLTPINDPAEALR